MSTFKPMLASPAQDITFPVWASYKIDGVRCVIRNGQALSRSLKPIPNAYIRNRLERPEYEGFDGELVVGSPRDKNVMQNTTSGVMSVAGEPEFLFIVFDYITDVTKDQPYWQRYTELSRKMGLVYDKHVPLLHQERIYNLAALDEMEERALDLGFEGLIIRDPESPYKYGRSTAKQGWMLKIKRFADSEAVVLGAQELMHNENEAFIGELGQTKRSSHQENKVASGLLGALEVEDLNTGERFNIGTGFTMEQRLRLWQNRHDLPRQIVKYKSFRQTGTKNAPRHPVFLGFRDERDM